MGKKDKDDDRKSEPSQRSPSSAAPGRSGSSSPSQPTRSAPVVREVANPNVVATRNDRLYESAPRMLGETTGGGAVPVNLAGTVAREPGTNPAIKPDTDKPVAVTPVTPATPTVIRKKRGTGLRLSPINTRVPKTKGPRKDATRSVDRSGRVVKGKAPPAKQTREDAKRRGAKPPKSAPSSATTQGRSTSVGATAARSSDQRDARLQTNARSSALRDAQTVSNKGSAKLTDKNYKGYDALDGKPDKRVCKERPTDTKPKRGGGGGKKKDFVPWCR